MEPLRDVRMNSGQEVAGWRVSTLDGAPVTSSSGLQITPDGAFSEDQGNRTLVLVAGYHVREQVTPALLTRLRSAVRRAERVLALDTAAWLLAAAGVLDGHTATIHWQELEAFTETFPKVEVSTARFVRSGPFLTCGGASTALDMIAMVKLLKAAVLNLALSGPVNTSAYQRNDRPSQLVMDWEALKL